MAEHRGARSGDRTGAAEKALIERFAGVPQLSLLSAQTAGQAGPSWITQGEFSTVAWLVFTGHLNNRRILLMNGGYSGCTPFRMSRSALSLLTSRRSRSVPNYSGFNCPRQGQARWGSRSASRIYFRSIFRCTPRLREACANTTRVP
jgi:hypothetical protein